MLYRPFGRQGFDVSTFGMGCMRLPQKTEADGTTHIDHEESIRMIRYAIDNGVNYLDTSCVYNNGESEQVIGEALQDGYRKKVHIATKVPPRILKQSNDEMREILEGSMKRLGVDFIDAYLIHHLDKVQWQRAKQLNVLDMMEKFKSEGLIGSVCFSYHGQLPTFRDIVNSYDWAMCQVQHNFLDGDREVTDEGINLAYEKGMAFVVMEPLRGGRLVNATPEVKALYETFPIKRSAAEWAFRYVYNYPQISCILSGVSTMEQLVENIAIFQNAYPNVMTPEEKKLIQDVKASYEKRIRVGCTGCEYCLPCPNNVPIPSIFSAYNKVYMFDDLAAGKRDYARASARHGGADRCIECGVCESHCPQSLNIIEELKNAHKMLI